MSESSSAAPRRGRLLWWSSLLAVLAAGLHFRFRDIGVQVLAGDEFHALRVAMKQELLAILTFYDEAENSIPLSMYARALMVTVGLTELNFRLPAIVSGLVILFSPFLFRRRLGLPAALLATTLLAVSPMAIYFTFVGRPYGPAAMLLVLAFLGWNRWIEQRSRRYLVLFTVSAALAVFFHLLCLLPVGWLVLMSWVAARRAELDYRRATWMTGLLLLLGIALLGPGVPGLLEHRLINSHRPGVGDPPLAWAAFLRLCGEHMSTTLSILALAILGGVRLVRREGLFGITLAGMFPMLLLCMFITQPWPTVHAWARYEYLALPFLLMQVGVGAAWLLEWLQEALGKKPLLAITALVLALAAAGEHLLEPLGEETASQLLLPWLLGAVLGAAGLDALLSRGRGELDRADLVPAAPGLALLWCAGWIAWTPVPILQEPFSSLRTARRSVQLVSEVQQAKLEMRLPRFFRELADDPDSGSALLIWPFTADTSQWRGILAQQPVHGKRVIPVFRGPLKAHEASGIHFENLTDRADARRHVEQGARYFIVNLDCVRRPGPSRGPFALKNPPIEPRALANMQVFLQAKFGEPVVVAEGIEVYDMRPGPGQDVTRGE